MDKFTLRKTILTQSRQLSPAIKENDSNKIWNNETLSTYLNQAKTIMFYWSLADEVATHSQVVQMAAKKKIVLPTIVQNDIVLKTFRGVELMVPETRFGILEPTGDNFNELESIDLVIVPGVAFDLHGYRLGRGKGFYDRFLPKVPHALKIGVCFDHQLVKKLPTEPHDIPMDMIVTPTQTIEAPIIKNYLG